MASPQTLASRHVRQQPPSVARATRAGAANTNNTNNNKQSDFAWMKHGIGRLTATADHVGIKSSPKSPLLSTKLTEVSHKAPMRWLPLRSSRVERAGAAVAAMSNYGAGLLPGDVSEVHVRVQAQARLGILTQGSNRIYKQQQQQQQQQQEEIPPAKSTLQASVHENSCLVLAPDPTVPFARSSFHQQQHFRVHPTSSLIAVDWFSSGRFANGERWKATRLSSETKLSLLQEQQQHHLEEKCSTHQEYASSSSSPLVWDAMTLDQRGLASNVSSSTNHTNNPFGFDLGQHSFNAFASVLLYGEHSLPVVEQLRALQYQLAESHTRLRRNEDTVPVGDDTADNLGTTGRVLLGVNELHVSRSSDSDTIGPLHMARLVGSSNEDLYRILHHSLKPLAPLFGLEFYQDRIRATSSGPAAHSNNGHVNRLPQNGASSSKEERQIFPSAAIPKDNESANRTSTNTSTLTSPTTSAATSWNAYMLADSALPTGSFAHSAGLEAASQMGLLAPPGNKKDTTLESSNGKEDNSDLSNVQMFIQAATRSTLQQATPWIMSGHEMRIQCSTPAHSNTSGQVLELVEKWEQLDRHVHAGMVCAAPACRASLDQGRNLLRVSIPWLQQDSSPSAASALELLQAIQEHINTKNAATTVGHMAPLFGILGGALQLQPEETCHLLGYCVARDIVSSAVRLNLIGPLASVGILSKAQSSAQEGVSTSLRHQDGKDGANLLWSDTLTGGCAPVVDAVHPCHDLLAIRLFRT